MVASKFDPYDIFSLQAQRNHTLYDVMRHEDPVHQAIDPQTGRPVWFLTRYDDCLNFLRDNRFGKEFRRRLPPPLTASWQLQTQESAINHHMLNLDDPDHSRLKSLVHLAFTPTQIQKQRPQLQALADNLFDNIDQQIDDGAEFDLSATYISQLPLMSIAVILGIPLEDYQQLYRWTQIMLLTEQTLVQPAIEGFSDYLYRLIDARRSKASEDYQDILSALIFAEADGDRLSREELLTMVFLLITAGYETMVNFISNAVMTLFEHPTQLQYLQTNYHKPTQMQIAVEELLRYDGPSHMTLASWAFEDVTIGEKLIQQGDIVHAVLSAANRDPSVFDNPHTLDLMRQPNKHIAFSYGIHHCLGAALARLEGDVAISTLLHRIPNL